MYTFRRVPENENELLILDSSECVFPVKDEKIDREKEKHQILYAINHGVNCIGVNCIS